MSTATANLIDSLPPPPDRQPRAGEKKLFEAFFTAHDGAVAGIESLSNLDAHPMSDDYKFQKSMTMIAIGRCVGLSEAIDLL